MKHYLKQELYELIKTDESFFDFIQESALDGLWYWDLQQPENEWMSPRFWEILGYDVAQMPHKAEAWQNIINADDLQIALHNFEQHLQNPQHAYDQVVRYRHKNGSTVWIRCRGKIIRDNKGNAVRMIGAHHDITALKRDESNLLQAQQEHANKKAIAYRNQLESIINNFPGGSVSLLNKDFVIIITGGANYEMHNLNPQYFINKPLNQVLTAEVYNINVPYLEQAFEGKSSSYLVSFENNYYLNRTCPVVGTSGSIEHVVLMSTNITELKNAENELIKAKEKAEESDRLKTAFLQNISHEIRTPMNAIMGFSRMLQKPDISAEQQQKYLNIVIKNSDQLKNIVEDILTIASIETNQIKLNTTAASVNIMMYLLMNDFQHEATNKNIVLSFDKREHSKKSEIYTDHGKLRQILSNLMSNALKFTHQGSVTIGYTINHNVIEFYIKDTGIGISNELITVIYDKFRQIDTSIARKYGGTGLGLSICKGFIELLDGNITVQSEVGKGTTFYVSIPYLPVFPINQHTNSILVVDDEIYNFMLIEQMLLGFDYNVMHAHDGIQAIEICKNNDIDLILMDIEMPKMNGYQTSIIIKQLYPNIPIIAQSAFISDMENNSNKHLFSDYIHKLLQTSILYEKINKYIF